MGTLVKLEGNEGLKIGTVAASNPGGGALVRIAGESEPYPTSPKPQQPYPVSHNPLLDVLPAPSAAARQSVKNGFELTPPSEESIQKWKDEKEERRKEAEKNNVYGNFQSTGGRQFSGGGTSIPIGQKEKSFGRKALDFVGGLGEAFQLGGQQTLSAIDQADYWLGVKLGLIDPKDEYTKQQAFALQNDIAEGMGELTDGKPKWQQMLTEGFQSAGNIFGSTMNLYATGLPNVAGQVVAPAAAKLAGAEAGLGATAAQKAAAGATRFAGNLLGSAAANMSGTNAAISAQSGVNKYSEAKNAGASDDAAFTAAIGAAAAEYFSNKLFSGTPLEDAPGEKGYVVKLIETISKRLGKDKALQRVLGSTAGKIGSAVFDKVGEGLEEVVTGFLDPFIDRLTFDEDKDLATAEELLDEFLGGVVMSLIVSAPGAARSGVNAISRANAENRTGRALGAEGADTLVNIGLSMDGEAKALAEKLNAKQKSGKTLTNREVGQLYRAISMSVDGESVGASGNPTVSSARESGVSESTAAMARRLSEITGRNIVFYSAAAENRGGRTYTENGYYDGEGTLHINAQSANPTAQIISHELTHALEGTEGYQAFRDAVLNRMAQSGQDVAQLRQQTAELYQRAGRPASDVDSELVAQYVEKSLLTDEAAIRDICVSQTTAARRILNWLDGILAKMGNQKAQERAAEREFLETARSFYRRGLAEVNAAGNVKGQTSTENVNIPGQESGPAAENITNERTESANERTARDNERTARDAGVVQDVAKDTGMDSDSAKNGGERTSAENARQETEAERRKRESYKDVPGLRWKSVPEARVDELLRTGLAELDGQQGFGNDGEVADAWQYSISETLDSDLQSVLDNSYKRDSGEVYIGETSNFLTDVIGADALTVTMPSTKAYSAMATEEEARAAGRYQPDTNYHGLGKPGLIRALEASENPVAAFADTGNEKSKRSGNIVLVTDEVGADGNIVVVESLNAKARLQGKRIEANKVITSFDRSALANDIVQAAADGRLLHLDKKRSQMFFAGSPAANSQGAMRNIDFTNNIRNFWANVKWENSGNRIYASENAESNALPEWKKNLQEYSKRQFSVSEDSQGRELSEAQQEYFKDSKAVDEEGRLLNIDGFYLNVEKKPVNLEPTEKNMEAYNAGVHFRETYGENTEAAWTRFFFDEPELAEKTMFYNSVNERYFNAGMRGELPQYRLAIRFGKIPENGRSKNWGTGELERGVSVVNFLNSKTQNEKTLYDYVYGMQGTEKTIVGGWDFGIYGTDGEPLLINPVTIAPASEINRIKLADNQNPTSDPDIRYSINEGKTQDELLDFVTQFQKATEERFREVPKESAKETAEDNAAAIRGDLDRLAELARQSEEAQGIQRQTPEEIAESKVNARVGEEKPGFMDRLRHPGQTIRDAGESLRRTGENVRDTGRYFYRKLVDSGEAVSRVGKQSGDRYLYAYYNKARASTNAAISMIENAATDINGRVTGKSLNAVLDPIRAKGDDYYNRFQLYLFHLHNVDRMSIENMGLVENARDALAKFREENPELNQYTNAEIQEMALDDSNVLCPQAREFLDLQKAVRTASEQNKPVFGAVTAEESEALAERLKQEHPEFEELAKDVYKYIDNLLQYCVDTGLIRPGDKENLQRKYPHYVPTYRVIENQSSAPRGRQNVQKIGDAIGRAKGSALPLMPLHKQLAQKTFSTVREGSKNLFAQRMLDMHNDDIRSVFRWRGEQVENGEKKSPNGWNIIVRDRGLEYQMNVSKAMYEAFKALSPDSAETAKFLKGMRVMNDVFKRLCTSANPTFLARNAIRDIQDAGINTKNGAGFAKAYPKALKEIAKNGEYWKAYQALGGTYSSFFDYQKGETKKSNFVKRWTVDKLEMANDFVEQMPRFTEFVATIDRAGGLDKAGTDVMMDAIYNAADVTTNFGRSGEWSRFLNRYLVPFFNPSVQGFDKMIRNITEAKGFKSWASLLIRSALLGIAPMLLNGLLYGDDDEWDLIRQSDKDLYYLFKLPGDGNWLRIPKGRVTSVIGMIGNRAASLVQGKDIDLAETFSTAASQVAPTSPFEANIFKNFTDAKLFDKTDPGTTWYGGDIESQRLQNLKPEERYDAGTDAISKWIGKATGLSPKKINYLLDQYSGVLGDVFLPLLSERPQKDIFSKAFTLDSTRSNRLSDEFYDRSDELLWAKDDSGADAVVNRWWNRINDDVSEINKAIREIESDPGKSDSEKNELLKVQYGLRNVAMQNALETEEEYRAAAEEAYEAAELGTEDDKISEAYREANRAVFGAEYALRVYSKDVYAKAAEAVKNGSTWDAYYDSYFGTKEYKGWFKYLSAAKQPFNDKIKMGTLSEMMDDDTYEALEEAHAEGISVYNYVSFRYDISNLKSDKDKDGKSISGSLKEKIVEVIDGLNLTSEQKDFLYLQQNYAESTLGDTPWHKRK